MKIDDVKGYYYCHGCHASGDHFTLLKELGGKSFKEAVEVLGGRSFITVEEREKIEARNAQWAEEERAQREKNRSASERTFAAGVPIKGTPVAAYLEARGLIPTGFWTFDLRYVAQLPYRGYASPDAPEEEILGKFPAMVAAIRNVDDQIIGVHRTFLQPGEPAKLTPPGDPKRNKARKVMGEHMGGLIRLSPSGKRLALGEGIETSQSWITLGIGDGEWSVAAAVSLGNLAGGSTEFVPHPTDDDRRIPSGQPDLERPGVVLPRGVDEVMLLGDGDSEPAFTKAQLLTAGRRFQSQGVRVRVSPAPAGMDWNDVLQMDAE
jgi:hypothetical protein